jgi:hypothetical protein
MPSQVLARLCLVCGQPMAPYRRAVYLASGAVVHAGCRGAVRGAATRSMAIIRPTSQALRLRARARSTAASLLP